MTKYKATVKTMTKGILRFATGDYGIVAVVAVMVLYTFSYTTCTSRKEIRMSIASSLNKLIAALMGENFSGNVVVSLKNNNLKVTSGKSELTVISDGVIYQLAEKDVSVLKDGNYTFKVCDGYLNEMHKLEPAAEKATKSPAKKTSGSHSSAAPKRTFD